MAWESPSRRRNPTPSQLIALSKLLDFELQQLTKMLPPEPLELKTKLCAACYAEQSFHRAQWQKAETEECAHHRLNLLYRLNLLSMCPVCSTGFRTPALWSVEECCEQCGLLFSEMRSHQQPETLGSGQY
jgi:hypothetical protein